MANSIIAGNDFRLIIRAKKSTGAYLADMDLADVEDLRIYLTRAGRSKVLQSYTLDEEGHAVIYVSAGVVTNATYGIEMVGVYGGARLRAHNTSVFTISGHGGGNSGVLNDYYADIVFVINVAATDVYVQNAIEAHNEDEASHPHLLQLIEEAGDVDDVQIDGESIVDENKIAKIDSSQFGKVDDVKVNGTSVVSNKEANITIPEKVSDLQNDADYATQSELTTGLAAKQDTITAVAEPTIADDGGNPSASVEFEGGEMAFAFKNLKLRFSDLTAADKEQIRGPQGDSAVYDPSSPDTPDFVMANTTGQSTTKAMTQKAVTDLFDGQYGEYDEDFAICDENGHNIVEFGKGHLRTKNFDSKKSPVVDNNDSNTDLAICDENGKAIVYFEGGHIHTKNFSSSDIQQGKSAVADDTFVIAAADSSVSSKKNADVICDGVNDSTLIENCIKSVQGACGTLIFCAGTYNMTFKRESDSSYAAILIPTNNKQINLVAQHFNGVTHPQVFFKVSQVTYESLEDDGIEYSIIKHATVSSAATSLNSHLKMSGICFEIYDNQKPITCINAQYTGQICMYECKGVVTLRPGIWSGTLSVIPSIDCVFFKGMQGWNHAYSEICRSTCAGFGIGWGVQGEHIYMNTCGAVNCLYGYAFNYYPLTTGMYVHPIILVNCLEECGLNFPYFGANTHKQSILIYNWHIEHKTPFFSLGGHYATESTPGQWYGHVDYAIQHFSGSNEHVVNIPFWADGCGHSLESINIVHKKIVTTSERNSYAPNYGQVVFDSTLNKQCICVNPENKTWVDTNGNEV